MKVNHQNSGEKGGYRGNRIWQATRLEGVQKNSGIKPVKKKAKDER